VPRAVYANGIWYIAVRLTAPVVVAAQALTDARERKSPRRTLIPPVAADCAAFSAVFPIVVKIPSVRARVIIYRAFYREALRAMAGIMAALLVVLLLFGLTATLGRTVRGDYAQSIVLQLIGWQTVQRLDLLLPLGFYLGVLLTFSRWYRDSEMTVLAACGIGLTQLLRPVMLLAVIVGALVAGSAFFLTPYAARAIERAKAEGNQRPELAGIASGAFTESAAGGRILYAEHVADDGAMERIFLSNSSGGRPRVILAQSGQSFVDAKTGQRRVVLRDGWAYEGTPAQADYRVVRFDSYSVWLDQKPVTPPPDTIEGLPTTTLLATSGTEASAEWHWRLAKPVHVFILALFAMVLARTDARRGRMANLFGAILVYFIYSNLLGLGQTLIKKSEVPNAVGLWWIHALMLAIAVYLLFRRSRNRPLVPRLRVAEAG
jgi:lipopolysaccharide export system permease protein